MKFHQLPVGQEFLFKGKTYVKASPVLATEINSGEQKFMRRADTVQLQAPLPSTSAPRKDNEAVQKTKVTALFECFFSTCTDLLEYELENIPSAKKHKISAQMQQARKRFLQDLG